MCCLSGRLQDLTVFIIRSVQLNLSCAAKGAVGLLKLTRLFWVEERGHRTSYLQRLEESKWAQAPATRYEAEGGVVEQLLIVESRQKNKNKVRYWEKMRAGFKVGSNAGPPCQTLSTNHHISLKSGGTKTHDFYFIFGTAKISFLYSDVKPFSLCHTWSISWRFNRKGQK